MVSVKKTKILHQEVVDLLSESFRVCKWRRHGSKLSQTIGAEATECDSILDATVKLGVEESEAAT